MFNVLALFTTALTVLGTVTLYFTVWKQGYKNRLYLAVFVLLPMAIYDFRRRKEINVVLKEKSKHSRPSRLRALKAKWSEGLTAVKLNGLRLVPGAKVENVKALQSRLVLRPDDIVVTSYPKSGTTWITQIIKLIRSNGVESGEKVEEAAPFVDTMTLAEAEVS